MNDIVIGAGPVGTTIALQLAEAGRRVRLLTRSGSGPEHPLVERRRADASKPADLARELAGASAVFDCMHGSVYSAEVWREELPAAEAAVLETAGREGALVVFPESLYSYGHVDRPMTEDMPRNATTGKQGVRAGLLRARAASATPTVSVVASDFYGPHARNAHAGERMLRAVLAGRRLQLIGSPDQPHSWTYVPDLAAAMIKAAEAPELWNAVLHAPTAAPLTQRQMMQRYATAAGAPEPKASRIPAALLKTIGLVHPGTREIAEMSYQFTGPFVLDSSRSERLLGLSPTPIETGVEETLAWWRETGD